MSDIEHLLNVVNAICRDMSISYYIKYLINTKIILVQHSKNPQKTFVCIFFTFGVILKPFGSLVRPPCQIRNSGHINSCHLLQIFLLIGNVNKQFLVL